MDTQNPAYSKQLALSPALLEEVADDPKVLTRYRRKMAFVNLVKMNGRALAGELSPAAHLQYLELLLKVDDAAMKAAVAVGPAAPALQISINFTEPGLNKKAVIEGAVTEVAAVPDPVPQLNDE